MAPRTIIIRPESRSHRFFGAFFPSRTPPFILICHFRYIAQVYAEKKKKKKKKPELRQTAASVACQALPLATPACRHAEVPASSAVYTADVEKRHAYLSRRHARRVFVLRAVARRHAPLRRRLFTDVHILRHAFSFAGFIASFSMPPREAPYAITPTPSVFFFSAASAFVLPRARRHAREGAIAGCRNSSRRKRSHGGRARYDAQRAHHDYAIRNNHDATFSADDPPLPAEPMFFSEHACRHAQTRRARYYAAVLRVVR